MKPFSYYVPRVCDCRRRIVVRPSQWRCARCEAQLQRAIAWYAADCPPDPKTGTWRSPSRARLGEQ